MRKNGSYFLSVIDSSDLRAGVWDPYAYREQSRSETLGTFTTVHKVLGRALRSSAFAYAPIEYRHIHRGTIPVFTLERAGADSLERVPMVGEACLLLGTMRAYLGNVLVTPQAGWLGATEPIFFAVKPEFVRITTKDGLVYFWWAFLQSPRFLHCLPVGSGGTRPRLDHDLLLRTPIDVPAKSVREQIHQFISRHAERGWRDYVKTKELLDSTFR